MNMSQNDSRSQEKQAGGEMATISPHLQHQWPALGKELFAREQRLSSPSVSTLHQQATQEHLRQSTLAHLYQAEGQYSRATRYLAFLLVKYGRGAELVGNPSCIGRDGALIALPYTGLEGYYAGSEQTATYPGLSRSDILHEEAERGAQLVKMLKKEAVEHNSWAEYVHLRQTLDGKEQKRETIRTLQTLWMTTVGQLRSRVYHHPEFEQTLTERIEQGGQMLSKIAIQTEEGRLLHKALQEEQNQLEEAYASMSEAEKTQERSERRKRERIRRARIEAFQHFRDETYHLLEGSHQEQYEVGIQDSSWDKATLRETIVLPRILARETYLAVQVHLTPEELDGYLFLAELGEIGADPLARSELVSQGIFE
jgi:hypothetical protein